MSDANHHYCFHFFFLLLISLKRCSARKRATVASLPALNRTCQLFWSSFSSHNSVPLTWSRLMSLVYVLSRSSVWFQLLFFFLSPSSNPPQKCCPIWRLKRVDSEPADWLEALRAALWKRNVREINRSDVPSSFPCVQAGVWSDPRRCNGLREPTFFFYEDCKERWQPMYSKQYEEVLSVVVLSCPVCLGWWLQWTE